MFSNLLYCQIKCYLSIFFVFCIRPPTWSCYSKWEMLNGAVLGSTFVRTFGFIPAHDSSVSAPSKIQNRKFAGWIRIHDLKKSTHWHTHTFFYRVFRVQIPIYFMSIKKKKNMVGIKYIEGWLPLWIRMLWMHAWEHTNTYIICVILLYFGINWIWKRFIWSHVTLEIPRIVNVQCFMMFKYFFFLFISIIYRQFTRVTFDFIVVCKK